ncbi:branched-chain amino acid transport system permease protein [Paenibacillus naphthalenovorans]|nr:branched-chain amino acid transport system permease protein [Paenibacillus naphthalenovorans]
MQMLLQVIVSGILLGGMYSLITIGLTLIFGVVRIVNFAHGEFLMLGMFLCYFLVTSLGIDPYLTMLPVAAVLFALGAFTQKVFIQPLLGDENSQLIITVGMMYFLQNAALFLFGGEYRTISVDYQNTVMNIGSLNVSLTKAVSFAITIFIIAALFLFLKKTFYGRAIRAVAQDRNASLLMGIPVNQVFQVTFGIGAAIVGVASCLLMPIFYVYPTVGMNFVLISFVVAVLGGLGDIRGALVGGLLIGVIESASGYYVSPGLKEAFCFVIFFLVLIFKPAGMLSSRNKDLVVE